MSGAGAPPPAFPEIGDLQTRWHDEVLTFDDGTTVAYWEFGDPEGEPVVALHGTPICGLCFAPLHDVARRRGIRVLAPDRPGVGRSTPYSGYSVAGWVDTLDAFLSALGVERFGLLGWSSGGPYALAVAGARPQRVRGTAVITAMAPIEDVADLDLYSEVDRDILQAARFDEPRLRKQVTAMVEQARRDPDVTVAALTRDLRQADRDLIASLGPRDEAFSLLPAVLGGADGLVDDYLALARDWGFDLASVHLPVEMFVGDSDPTIPVPVAERLCSRLPNVRLRILPDEGHLLIYTHADEVLSAALGHLEAGAPTHPSAGERR